MSHIDRAHALAVLLYNIPTFTIPFAGPHRFDMYGKSMLIYIHTLYIGMAFTLHRSMIPRFPTVFTLNKLSQLLPLQSWSEELCTFCTSLGLVVFASDSYQFM